MTPPLTPTLSPSLTLPLGRGREGWGKAGRGSIEPLSRTAGEGADPRITIRGEAGEGERAHDKA